MEAAEILFFKGQLEAAAIKMPFVKQMFFQN